MAELPAWVGTTLWPGAVPASGWLGRSRRRIVAIPSAASPRQLLPWTAAAAVGASSRATDDRARHRSVLDGLGVLGLLAMAPFDRRRRLVLQTTGHESLVDHLRAQIDSTVTNAIVMCGPVRANQKPVLQLLDRWGRTRAFVKVGWNPLTRSLLASEQNALQHLATVDHLDMTIPQRPRLGRVRWRSVAGDQPRGCRASPLTVARDHVAQRAGDRGVHRPDGSVRSPTARSPRTSSIERPVWARPSRS